MTTREQRIQGVHSFADAVVLMADGNPGSTRVMCEIMAKKGSDGIWTILRLDEMGIYGSDIWLAYKDACGEDLERLITRCQNDRDGLLKDIKAAGGLNSRVLGI